MMLKCRKGFTLVELMVVVAILAILILVAAPIYVRLVEKPSQAACQSDQRMLETLNMLYDIKYQHYPDDLEDLVREKLIHKIPTCPAEGERYAGVISLLPDGQVTCSGGTSGYPHALPEGPTS